MAAITTIVTPKARVWTVRTATAQATTGQTDWVAIPSTAGFMVVYLNMSATGGTTPGPTLVHLKTVDPIARDDSNTITLLTATGGLANTGLYTTEVGPGLAGGTNIVNATRNVFNAVLPSLLGIQVVLDRTNTDETYTYTLRIEVHD